MGKLALFGLSLTQKHKRAIWLHHSLGKADTEKEASQRINTKGSDATAKTDSVVTPKNSIRNANLAVDRKPAEGLDVFLDHRCLWRSDGRFEIQFSGIYGVF